MREVHYFDGVNSSKHDPKTDYASQLTRANLARKKYVHDIWKVLIGSQIRTAFGNYSEIYILT
jgi:hypothetical protein